MPANYVATTTNVTGYTYDTFIDGVQNYNKATSESWGNAKKSDPKVGDVINTKSETITLNAGDKTFTWTAASSAYEVKALKEKAHVASDYDKLYEDRLPYYIVSDGTEDLAYAAGNAKGFTGDKAKSHTAAAAILKQAKEKVVPVLQAQAQKAFDDAYAHLSPADKATYDAYTTDAERAADGNIGSQFSALKTAKDNTEAVTKAFDQATYMAEGAEYSILDTETTAGATKGTLTYYAPKDGKITGKVIKVVDKAGGTAKDTASGVYTISTNDYKNASITVTTYKSGSDTIVFNADGKTYTKNGLVVLNEVDKDFPKATKSTDDPAYTGNKLQKAARELTISNGKLTAPRFISSYTDKTVVDSTNKAYVSNNGFLLSSSWTSFDDAKADFDIVDGNLAKTLEKKVSYSYVWK